MRRTSAYAPAAETHSFRRRAGALLLACLLTLGGLPLSVAASDAIPEPQRTVTAKDDHFEIAKAATPVEG